MRVPSPLHLRPRAGWRGLLAAGALALLAACASTGPAGPGVAPGVPAASLLSGTLVNVDHANRRLLLAADDGSRADIAYDTGTRADAPAGLRPGDRVAVRATRAGRLWHAESIQAGATGGAPDPVPAADAKAAVQGVVSQVDGRARAIAFTEGGATGAARSARYDAATAVEFQGRPYPVGDLERGDMIRLWLRRSDRGWIAERVVVEARAQDR